MSCTSIVSSREVVDEARAAIDASAYPAESSYLPIPLAGLNELLEKLPLVCRLASRRRESLTAWLEAWTFIDEEGARGRSRMRSGRDSGILLEALLSAGHVISGRAADSSRCASDSGTATAPRATAALRTGSSSRQATFRFTIPLR